MSTPARDAMSDARADAMSDALPDASRDAALSLRGITRRFGHTIAVDDATFTLRRGTVHALLGENGAGKTTLMRIAFGMLAPDRGSMQVNGHRVTLASPLDALKHGIGMVHQHFTLVPPMTVAENVALGGRGRFDPARAAALVHEVAERAGLTIDPHARVEALSASAQQRVEIVKALARNVRVLVLDEPTSVLAPAEAQELLRWVRAFADAGNAVVLITHKLRDALAVADDITVLRRGRVVMTGPAAGLAEQRLASAMLGEDSSISVDASAPEQAMDQSIRDGMMPPHAVDARDVVDALDTTGDIVREHVDAGAVTGKAIAHATRVVLRDETGAVRVREASIVVHAGEIVGIAGIDGAGQHELLMALAGRLVHDGGSLEYPARVGFIPEQRQRDALMLDEDIVTNLALRDAGARRGAMHWRDRAATGAALLERFDVRGAARGVRTPVRALSGGNQQKLVVGRELHDVPPLLVAENPTHGLDFNATAAVWQALRDARDAGAAIVFHSSDIDEVLALADRVYVMRAGMLTPTLRDREAVGRAMLLPS